MFHEIEIDNICPALLGTGSGGKKRRQVHAGTQVEHFPYPACFI
jgi:hypothetical protein